MFPKYDIKRRKKLIKVGDVVDSIFKLNVVKEGGVGIEQVTSIWREIVGEKISLIARPKELDDYKLTVYVKSGVWRQELQFMSSSIIKNINRKVNNELVKKIIFK